MKLSSGACVWIGIAVLAACGRAGPDAVGAQAGALVGAEVDLASTMLVPPPGLQVAGTALWDGSTYIATWNDTRELFPGPEDPSLRQGYYSRVATDGSVLDHPGIRLPIRDVVGACNGAGRCLLVTVDAGIVGVRIEGDEILDPVPLSLVPAGGLSFSNPSVAWDSAGFRIVWSEGINQKILTATVGLDGTATAPIEVAADARAGAVACAPASCLITYLRSGPTTPESSIRGRILDGGGLGPERVIFGELVGKSAGQPLWDGARYWVPGTTRNLGDPNQTGSVWVTRVAANGDVLDPTGIVLFPATPGHIVSLPQVVHDGTTAVVVWTDDVTTDVDPPVGRAARVTAAGVVLDPGGVPFGSPANVVCGVGQCFSTFTLDVGFDRRVRGSRFVGTTLLDPGGIAVSLSPPGTAEAAAVYAFGQYAAAWHDSRDSTLDPRRAAIRGTLFSPALVPTAPFEVGVTAPPPFTFCPAQDQPAIAASMSVYLIVYHEGCPMYYDNIDAQALSSAGAPIGPAIRVSSTGRNRSPSVASHGGGFLAAWERVTSPRTTEAQLFDASGAKVGGTLTLTTNGARPVVSFDGTNYLIVWQRAVGGQRNLYGVRVTPAGAVLGPEISVFIGGQLAEGQSVACGGGVCLVVVRDFTMIRAVRIADGSVVAPGPVAVGPVTGTTSATSVAWDGDGWVFAWRTGAVHRVRRLAMDGTLDPALEEVIDPPTQAERPALVSNGAGQVIAMYDRFDASPEVRVRRVRTVAVTGEVTPPPDAGVPDAAIDAAIDAAVPDAMIDAGVPDAMIDAAVPDAAIDAAVPDAAIDAAVPDAAIDASLPPDAGGGGGGGDGCEGCGTSGDPASLLGGLAVLGAILRRHRRRGPLESRR